MPLHRGVNLLKFWLMPFVCFALFGLPDTWGTAVSQLSNFAAAAFFILTGYLQTENEDLGNDQSGKWIARTAVRFLLLFVMSLAIVVFIYLMMWKTPQEIIAIFVNRRALFEILVLCRWPFNNGNAMWFIQSLLYARIILWLMKKLRLMRFYKVVMALCFLAALVLGELSGAIRLFFHGYYYLPQNWLSCALPYMLLGRLVYEKREKLLSMPSLWAVGVPLGAALAFLEFHLLSAGAVLRTADHAVGFAVMALSICCLFLRLDDMPDNFFSNHGKSYARRIYDLCIPVNFALLMIAGNTSQELLDAMQNYGGILVYLVCLLLAFSVGNVMYATWMSEGEMFLLRWKRFLG